MFNLNKIKDHMPKFFNKRTKPHKYIYYMKGFEVSKSIDDLKDIYDIRFSLLIQSMLRNENSISKEALAELNMFMVSFFKDIENSRDLFLRHKEDISNWCIENNIKAKQNKTKI